MILLRYRNIARSLMLLQVFDLMIVDIPSPHHGFKAFKGLTVLRRASHKVYREHK